MQQVEIMAPAGNFECLAAAAQAGAHAVYFGVGALNMRSRAAHNFTVEQLPQITDFCRAHGMRSYLTVNTILYDEDLEALREVLTAARQAQVSAVIASDMAAILEARALGLEVHASTQLNISNIEALAFYAQFVDVAVLARELSLPQIAAIAAQVRERGITGPGGQLVKLELFCHGALCMAVSGKCYLSLHEYGESANRGACYQVCRRSYRIQDRETGAELDVDNRYILSPKDLCTVGFVDKLMASGVSVFKIEGRARAAEYVLTTVRAYKEAVEAVQQGTFTPHLVQELEARLKKVFNRGFWGGYYQGAQMDHWSRAYGSQATERKTYAAKVTNYFSKLGVAELRVEAAPLHVGDRLLIMGATTGVLEETIRELRLDLDPVAQAPQGVLCSLPVSSPVRRGDKVYLVRDSMSQSFKQQIGTT